MTPVGEPEDRTATADSGEGGADDEPALAGPMRFTVMDRCGDRVHLVSVEADTDTLFGHPSVCEAVWQAALDDVPPNWEIVDLCPEARPPDAPVTPDGDEEVTDLDDFAARKYDLFLAFLGAGFERCEALTLVIETLHAGDDG